MGLRVRTEVVPRKFSPLSSLDEGGFCLVFVSADEILCDTARVEGLVAQNPNDC
jgi:hypothetical protein